MKRRIRMAYDTLLGRPWQRKAAPFAWPAWREGRPQWQLIDFSNYVNEGFNMNALIYSAVMFKVRALQAATLRAYGGTQDAPEVLEEAHPLAKLVARPNVHQGWKEMQGQATVYFNLAGNCYFLLVRPKAGGLPQEVYCLRPDRVFIVPGRGGKRQGLLAGYLYVPEGKRAWGSWTEAERRKRMRDGGALPMLPEDVMHVKLPNPGDPLEGLGYGLSPLSPAAHSADVDNDVTRFLREFFERGLRPDVAISYDAPLDDVTYDVVAERVKERYGGHDRWIEPLILGQGGKVQRLGYDFQELGFEAVDERNESRVLGPFGVPPILIGTRMGLLRSTFSNYELARRACWEDTLVPELALFEQEFQYYLRGDDGSFAMYDLSQVPALRQDVPRLVDAAFRMWSMGVPANRCFAAVGLPVEDVPGGDVGYLPMNLIPVTGGGGEPETEAGAAEAEADARKELLARELFGPKARAR